METPWRFSTRQSLPNKSGIARRIKVSAPSNYPLALPCTALSFSARYVLQDLGQQTPLLWHRVLLRSLCPAPRVAARAARAAMALSKLSADEQGIILGQLCNALEPRRAVYFSSASSGLRVLLTPALLQQLRADHEVAAALCRKVGMRSCKDLREATTVQWIDNGLSATDLTTLGKLGSVLPALQMLALVEGSGAAGPDGIQRLAEGLGAGALPGAEVVVFGFMNVGDAGASALATALDRGALPGLQTLQLLGTAIGDAGLVALAPALRRRPALDTLSLVDNPFGDEGLAALLAPPPPAGALTLPTGVLKKLKWLNLDDTHVTDAGCAALAAALASGALPALKGLKLNGIPASDAAKAAVYAARANLSADVYAARANLGANVESEDGEDESESEDDESEEDEEGS